MGFLDRLSGAKDVARVVVSFRDDGEHRVAVERQPAAPDYLQGPVLDVALFLHYAVKALHALGSGAAADELRQHIGLSAVVLRMHRFEPFVSFIDRPGECAGQLQMNRSGELSINTRFDVPLAETNNYVLDSVLLVLNRAVQTQPTAAHCGRIANAAETLERYYQAVADPASFKALQEAAAVAFEGYRRDM